MKLLVASEFPPNASGGGPAVVRQMLRGWPVADLFWWSCLPEPDGRFGQSVRRHFCSRLPIKLLPQRRFTKVKSALLGCVWAPWAAAHFRRTIRWVRPEAIWVVPHNWSILPLAAALPEARTGIHVTVQDYVDVHGQVERFGPKRCRRMAALADHIYASATTRDATSRPMIADLLARTRAGAAQMLHAGLEESDSDFLESGTAGAKDEVRIAYAGSILVPREFALFVEAVDLLRASLDLPVSLHLFGSHSYVGERWFDSAWMKERGNLAEPELLAALRGCTWGFSPMALTDRDPQYNRYSFPTKFITYLTAGLPIITLGHPECSLRKMADRYAVGPTSSAMDAITLAEQLRSPLAEANVQSRYRQEILRCAHEEFNARRMRSRLYECFEQCAKLTKSMNTGSLCTAAR